MSTICSSMSSTNVSNNSPHPTTERCGFPKLKRINISKALGANIDQHDNECNLRIVRDSGTSFPHLNLLNSCLQKRDISSLKFMQISQEIDGGLVPDRK